MVLKTTWVRDRTEAETAEPAEVAVDTDGQEEAPVEEEPIAPEEESPEPSPLAGVGAPEELFYDPVFAWRAGLVARPQEPATSDRPAYPNLAAQTSRDVATTLPDIAGSSLTKVGHFARAEG